MWYVLELGDRVKGSRELPPVLSVDSNPARARELDVLAQAFRRAIAICSIFCLKVSTVEDAGKVRAFAVVRCEPGELQRLRIQYGRPLLVHGMAIPLPACDVAVGE